MNSQNCYDIFCHKQENSKLTVDMSSGTNPDPGNNASDWKVVSRRKYRKKKNLLPDPSLPAQKAEGKRLTKLIHDMSKPDSQEPRSVSAFAGIKTSSSKSTMGNPVNLGLTVSGTVHEKKGVSPKRGLTNIFKQQFPAVPASTKSTTRASTPSKQSGSSSISRRNTLSSNVSATSSAADTQVTTSSKKKSYTQKLTDSRIHISVGFI